MARMAWDRVAVASLCLLAAGAACKRSAPAEQAGEGRGNVDSANVRTPVPTKRPRRAKSNCLADTMGALSVGVQQSPACSEDAASSKCGRACATGDASACYQHALAIDKDAEANDEAHQMCGKACH